MSSCARPMIGIVPLFDSKLESYWMLPGYMKMIEKNGGLPVMLPLSADAGEIEEELARCDGFLFPGGQDVEPGRYGQERADACGEVCSERDCMEWALLGRVIERGIPFLGICRGLQLLNAYLGGTLVQDLGSQHPSGIEHCSPHVAAVHRNRIDPGTQMGRIMGVAELPVNSLHHQAVDRLADDLTCMALSEDGLVEGVGLAEHPFGLAVQWHPELSFGRSEPNNRLAASFVAACTER